MNIYIIPAVLGAVIMNDREVLGITQTITANRLNARAYNQSLKRLRAEKQRRFNIFNGIGNYERRQLCISNNVRPKSVYRAVKIKLFD